MDVLRKLRPAYPLTPATVWFHPHHHFYSETHRQRQTWAPLRWNNLNFPKSTTNSSRWTTIQNIKILNTTTKYFTKISGLRNFCLLLGMTDTKWFAWTVTAMNDHTTICFNFQLSRDLLPAQPNIPRSIRQHTHSAQARKWCVLKLDGGKLTNSPISIKTWNGKSASFFTTQLFLLLHELFFLFSDHRMSDCAGQRSLEKRRDRHCPSLQLQATIQQKGD